MAYGTNPAHHLFLRSPGTKNGFYIFNRLERKTKEEYYFMTHEKYSKFRFQCP